MISNLFSISNSTRKSHLHEFYSTYVTLTFAAKISSLQRTQRSGPWRCPWPFRRGGGWGEGRGDGGWRLPWLRMARDLAVGAAVAAGAVGATEANEGRYDVGFGGGGGGGGAGNLAVVQGTRQACHIRGTIVTRNTRKVQCIAELLQ